MSMKTYWNMNKLNRKRRNNNVVILYRKWYAMLWFLIESDMQCFDSLSKVICNVVFPYRKWYAMLWFLIESDMQCCDSLSKVICNVVDSLSKVICNVVIPYRKWYAMLGFLIENDMQCCDSLSKVICNVVIPYRKWYAMLGFLIESDMQCCDSLLKVKCNVELFLLLCYIRIRGYTQWLPIHINYVPQGPVTTVLRLFFWTQWPCRPELSWIGWLRSGGCVWASWFRVEIEPAWWADTIELFLVILNFVISLRFQLYIVVVWNFQLFMLPLVLLLIFIKNLLVVQIGDAILKENKPDVRTEWRVPFKIFHNSQWLFSMWGSEFLLVYGTDVEIQLPLKRFPDSSVSTLILVGWCEEGHPANKNLLKHSHG